VCGTGFLEKVDGREVKRGEVEGNNRS
jgi:hypothetical protein